VKFNSGRSAESMNMLKPVFTILFLLASCACTRYIELNPKLDKQSLYDPIPLTVGYYKNPELINRLEERDYNRSGSFVFPIGQASTELFEQILATMFAKVVPTPNRNIKRFSGTQQLAGIIDIDITEFFSSVDSMYTGNPFPYSITYKISITDSFGNPVASWPVTSHCNTSQACPGRLFCTHSDVVEFVMQDAMAKFMVDFHNKPEITKWLSDLGVKEREVK